MSRFSTKFFFSALIIITILVTGFACIKVEQPATSAPATSAPAQSGGNQPPVISSVTPSQNQIHAGGNVDIQVVASDPDGDNVGITWEYTGGTIGSEGYVVTWQAPNDLGEYTITAVASDGKGGSAQQSIKISVVSNQSPQITSITADPPTLQFGQQTLITCIASDPDGDTLKYSWKPEAGTISGGGPSVTWNSPSKNGTFNITVTVTDSKGGSSQQNIGITVSAESNTMELTLIPAESGTVSSDGNRDTSMMKAGDDDKNIGYRAFFSFNITDLSKANIENAKLIFSTGKEVGNPFVLAGAMSFDGLMLKTVNYTDRLPAFNITSSAMLSRSTAFDEPPDSLDITADLKYAINTKANRLQIVASFNKITNGDGVSDWLEWTDVKIQVVYTNP